MGIKRLSAASQPSPSNVITHLVKYFTNRGDFSPRKIKKAAEKRPIPVSTSHFLGPVKRTFGRLNGNRTFEAAGGVNKTFKRPFHEK